ncbi:PP2C family protein-serine/threonine phosphatase [Oxalobacteraceae bacterium A2-2]
MGEWKQLTPSQPLRLRFGTAYGLTDVGTVREVNQDNFLIDPDLGLLAVADGMGGHDAGEVASREALALLHRYLRDSGRAPHPTPAAGGNDAGIAPGAAGIQAMLALQAALDHANAGIYEHNRVLRQPEGAGMGTTLTGVWRPLADGPVLVFHVGDSRLYRWRAGRLTQVTRDQTLYQQALEAGVRHMLPARNLLLQALGPAASIQPELQSIAVLPGDAYLLCSDGLHGDTAAANIASVLEQLDAAGLEACCARLVEMAKLDGSRDNITAVLLQCDG